MRIRSIKPEFWRSDDVTSLAIADRLLFIGLWSYVDDNGVGLDDYRRITADLFALEEDQEWYRNYVRDGLATLSRGFLILRYEWEDKKYLFIPTWDQHQRVDKPAKPRFPRPSGDMTVSTSGNPFDVPLFEIVSRNSREGVAPGAVEQWSSGAVKKTRPRSAAVDHELFAEFYDAYPRKEARPKASKAFSEAVKRGAKPEFIVDRAKRYAKTRIGEDRKYTALPASWLNADRFNDEMLDNGPKVDPKTGAMMEQGRF